MGQTTVAFEDYRAGRLPDVCVLTGVRTEDRMIIRTPIALETSAARPAGRVLGSLDRLLTTLDARRPRDILLGRLPVDAAALRRRRRELRMWLVVAVGGLIVLAASAWAGAAWSPIGAVLSVAFVVVAMLRRAELRRRAPRPTLIGAGTRVHLANVHPRFVDSVEAARGG